MRELFIYYRIQAGHAAAVSTAVLGLQARLRARHPGLATQLYQRLDKSMAQHTWMETYALRGPGESGGIDPTLQSEIEAEAACITSFLIGPRHTEVFSEVRSPCVS